MTEPQASGQPIETALLVPERRPGSARRTSTTEMLRPEGSPGPLVLVGRARDLVTRPDGRAMVAGSAELHIRVGVDGQIESLHSVPHDPGCAPLIGARVRSGFRAALEQALPEQRAGQSLLYQLLDELPVAAMITGYAVVRDARANKAMRQSAAGIRLDVCAGWRSEGEIARRGARGQGLSVPLGAPAPNLARAEDPLAWHALEPLPPGAMRRHRRLDLILGEPLLADAMLRDVFFEADGSQTILHEYHVEARLDPADLRVLEVRATPGVLPSIDCRLAIGSTTQIPLAPVAELRRHASEHMKGPATCTHLNDVFRSLSDSAALLGLLRQVTSGSSTQPQRAARPSSS